jgi:hypothetical protein
MTRPQVIQLGLFDVARARRDDPETSKRAAESIPLERLTRTQELVIYGLSTHGPATDEELINFLPERSARFSDLRSKHSLEEARARQKGPCKGLGVEKANSAWAAVGCVGGVVSIQCAWSPACPQEPGLGAPFCYFHAKRALEIINGPIYDQGQLSFEMQPPSFEALEIIQRMTDGIERDDD